MNPTKPRILVVDDESIVRDSLDGWFSDDGYEVGTASDAKQALAMIRDAVWDIILLDIKMPGMDGLELQKSSRTGSNFNSAHKVASMNCPRTWYAYLRSLTLNDRARRASTSWCR